MKELVLVGGGHAHVEVLRDFAEHPDEGRRVTLVTPHPWLTYSGMVPGLFAGHYEIDECTVDLRALAERTRARIEQTSVIRVDTSDREVVCDNGARLHYDILSLDVGVAPYTVGVRVVTNTGLAVPEFPAGARQRLTAKLRRRNIGLHTGSAVTEVGPDFVRLEQGLEFASDAVFFATGGGAHPWIRASGFSTDERGFLLTNDRLQSVSHPDVFGAGDCASVEGRSHAKAGVFAVRAAPALAANLRAALAGQPLQPHASNARYLALVSTGNRHAVGVWDGWSWEGDWVWRWKDRIDRAFVARYGTLPAKH